MRWSGNFPWGLNTWSNFECFGIQKDRDPRSALTGSRTACQLVVLAPWRLILTRQFYVINSGECLARLRASCSNNCYCKSFIPQVVTLSQVRINDSHGGCKLLKIRLWASEYVLSWKNNFFPTFSSILVPPNFKGSISSSQMHRKSNLEKYWWETKLLRRNGCFLFSYLL